MAFVSESAGFVSSSRSRIESTESGVESGRGIPALTPLLFPATTKKGKEQSFEVKLLQVRKQVICWNVRVCPGQNAGEKGRMLK